jgi:hypothetical protein
MFTLTNNQIVTWWFQKLAVETYPVLTKRSSIFLISSYLGHSLTVEDIVTSSVVTLTKSILH